MTRRGPRSALAYYDVRAGPAFWSRHWETQSLDELLHIAERSELTRFLERFVRAGDRMLEAGCGLGQYVRYFAERGVEAVGVESSAEAVRRHLSTFPGSDVRVADLRQLPFAAGSLDVYVSLGVLEHYVDGGAAILAEALRVLAGDGTLLVSTPYENVVRRGLRRRIEARQRAIARSGGRFHQFAFDEPTLDGILSEAGFEVVARSYYDPGRGLHELRGLFRGRERGTARTTRRAHPFRGHGPVKRAVLYARPTLKLLAHMQIVAARKA